MSSRTPKQTKFDNSIEWLSDKGVGMVVNPTKGVPDYVFTYGMLWNYRERAQFQTISDAVHIQIIALVSNTIVLHTIP